MTISPRTYPPDWLDDTGAAYALSLPVSTFRQYVEAGILPNAVKIGKHSRWSRAAFSQAKLVFTQALGAEMPPPFFGQVRIVVNGHSLKLNSEQYAAILRIRYRKLLLKRGVPLSAMNGSHADLFTIAKITRPCVAFQAPGPHFS